MSGFDTDWLSLREPADKAARNPALIDMLLRYLEDKSEPVILDIGCGTGSTWRNLEGCVPENTQWLLLDHDPLLLKEAERRIGGKNNVAFRQFDLNNLADLPLLQNSIVTASALFDLASEDFCTAFVDRLYAEGCGLYAALNYDGIMRWARAHPLDETMVAAFNLHQQTDKGFGKALGPHATECLEALLRERGYQVYKAESPWRMDENTKDLQEAFLSGFRQPLMEMAENTEADIETWLSYRLSTIGEVGNLCEVGHTDIIAFPA